MLIICFLLLTSLGRDILLSIYIMLYVYIICHISATIYNVYRSNLSCRFQKYFTCSDQNIKMRNIIDKKSKRLKYCEAVFV